MSIQNIVSEEEYQLLINHFGKQKINRVSNILEAYVPAWQLSNLALIPYYSVNILLTARLADDQSVILKIHSEVDSYTTREISMLQLGLPLYCRLINYNEADGVLLLEKGEGHSLHHINDLYTRLDVFAEIFNRIHQEAKGEFPSYLDLLHNIEQWATQQKLADLLVFIHEAIEMYSELHIIYPDKYVLHGDLHHDNIKYDENCSPMVIDPKGIIDHKLFDIPRFILNELTSDIVDSDIEKIINVIKYLSHKLNFSAQHIAKVFCIEGILSITWTIQDSEKDVDLQKYINQYLFIRQFVNKVQE